MHQLCLFLEMSDLATVMLQLVQKLQLVQNAAVSLLTGAGYRKHVFPWAQFKMLVMTYKALYSLGLGYLKDHFSFSAPAWVPSSSDEHLL